MTISPVTRDELLKICGRIGESKSPGLEGIPNRVLTVAVKCRPDMFANLFEAVMSGRSFSAL